MAATPRVPALHDVVRIATPNREETVRRLVKHLTRAKPPWTYKPVRCAAAPLLARALPLRAALHGCGTGGTASGRPFNVAVAKLVWQAGQGRALQCHPLGIHYFQIRHDLRLRIPVDFYLVENGVPVVFWLQPRKGFALDDFQRGLLASVVRQEISTEWDEFGFEMLDTSAMTPKEPRFVRTYRFDDAPPVTERDVATVMQQFADAFDVVSQMDLGLSRDIRNQPSQAPGDGPLFDHR